MLSTFSSCNVCGSSDLEEVISLPNLPLTGLYYPSLDQALSSPKFDQGLTLCNSCGHSQLTNYIDPSIVYDDTYTHRTSTSPLSTKGNDFLYNYIVNSLGEFDASTILEAGCNDCYLLKRLQCHWSSCNFYGFDPIWINKNPIFSGLNIFGSFVEDVSDNLPQIRPNLIVSAHTFEHVPNLYTSLLGLVEMAADDAQIIVEMPSFDTLLRLRRFDQIFHQHIQYISEASILSLSRRLSCQLVDITYNYSYWGGTVIFRMKKTNKIEDCVQASSPHTSIQVQKYFSDFQQSINLVSSGLSGFTNISYLGAAQMLPILDYHIDSQISFSNILDDNPLRTETYLPNMPIQIKALSSFKPDPLSAFVVGAVDSSQALIKRSKELSFSNLFSIFNCLV